MERYSPVRGASRHLKDTAADIFLPLRLCPPSGPHPFTLLLHTSFRKTPLNVAVLVSATQNLHSAHTGHIPDNFRLPIASSSNINTLNTLNIILLGEKRLWFVPNDHGTSLSFCCAPLPLLLEKVASPVSLVVTISDFLFCLNRGPNFNGTDEANGRNIYKWC